MQTCLEISGNILAFITGCLLFRYSGAGGRFIFLHVVLGLVNEWVSASLANNIFVNNVYLLIDVSVLIIAGMLIFVPNEKRKVAYYLLFAFILTWIINIYTMGINQFANISFGVGGCILVALYCYGIFTSLIKNRNHIATIPVFWLCIGIIIFYGCSTPYLSLFNILYRFLKNDYLFYLHNLLVVLSNWMYVCIVIYFYVIYKNKKDKTAVDGFK